VTARKLQRIPPVGLDLVPGLLRNQRRRYHIALYSQLGQLPVKYEARRAGFIAGPQLLRRTKLADELANRIFAVGDRSQTTNLTIRFSYCNGDRFGMESMPKNRNFSIMTGSLRLWLWTKVLNKLSLTHD
jgi:hypothetical protein